MSQADDFTRQPVWPQPVTPEPGGGRPLEQRGDIADLAGLPDELLSGDLSSGLPHGLTAELAGELAGELAAGLAGDLPGGLTGNPPGEPSADLASSSAVRGPYLQPQRQTVTDLGERVAWDLMRQFRGWTCWLGKCTGQWWALSPGHTQERLLSADSPHELGQRIKEAVSVSGMHAPGVPQPRREAHEPTNGMLVSG